LSLTIEDAFKFFWNLECLSQFISFNWSILSQIWNFHEKNAIVITTRSKHSTVISTLFVANRFSLTNLSCERIQTKHPPGSFHSDRLFLCIKESSVLDHCLFFLDTKLFWKNDFLELFFCSSKRCSSFVYFPSPLEFHSIWDFSSRSEWLDLKKKKPLSSMANHDDFWVDIIFVPNNRKRSWLFFFFILQKLYLSPWHDACNVNYLYR